jgi:hypothetical protein
MIQFNLVFAYLRRAAVQEVAAEAFDLFLSTKSCVASLQNRWSTSLVLSESPPRDLVVGSFRQSCLAQTLGEAREVFWPPEWRRNSCKIGEPQTQKIAGRPAANPDLLAHYLAMGDVIAEKVHNGELSDAQGKLALANELHGEVTVVDERLRRSFEGLTAAGLAISAASAPPPSVNCTTVATGVVATVSRRD